MQEEKDDMENNFKKALIISRPVSWIPIVLAYLLGVFLSGGMFTSFVILEAILLSFPYSFYTYGINDIYDGETDKGNIRKKSILWGQPLEQKDKTWVKNIAFFFGLIILVVAISTQNIAHIFAALVSVIFVYIYSAPPIRLKSRAFMDSLSNAIYPLGAFAIGYSLNGGFGFLHSQFLLFALAFSGVHALGTIADMKEDKKAKISTFALSFGPRIPALFAAIVFLANIPFGLAFMKSTAIVLALYTGLSLYVAMKPTSENAKQAWSFMLGIAFIWLLYAAIALISGFENMNLSAISYHQIF